MQWPETTIQTLRGLKTAIAPFVISASRATDIPAFHTEWFMNRLRAGYCLWKNPFNAHQQQYVSFEKCRVFVFWSKNPQNLMPHLSQVEERGYQYYFQYTLNDYEQEGLEPCVPKLDQRIATFRKLSGRIGKHRVIWRFDPIIMGNTLTVESLLERIYRLAEQLAPCTEKLVFSFLDLYRKTENNLKKLDPHLRPPNDEEIRQIVEGLVQINRNIPSPLHLSTCAEKHNFRSLGVEHNKCVDPDLLFRLCPASPEMQGVYAKPPTKEQGRLVPSGHPRGNNGIKDAGQRTLCGCAPSKDIGCYNTCMHFCAYCYANQSKVAVTGRIHTADVEAEKMLADW